MPKLPSAEDLGQLPQIPSKRRYATIQTPPPLRAVDTTPIGRSIANFGKSIAQFSGFVDTLAAKEQQQQEYDTERRFQQYTWDQSLALEEAKKNIQPEQLNDFAVNQQKINYENNKAFFNTIPEHLRAKYEPKLIDFERKSYDSAYTFQSGQQTKMANVDAATSLTGVYVPRAASSNETDLPTVVSDWKNQVRLDPRFRGVGDKEVIIENGTKQIVRAVNIGYAHSRFDAPVFQKRLDRFHLIFK